MQLNYNPNGQQPPQVTQVQLSSQTSVKNIQEETSQIFQKSQTVNNFILEKYSQISNLQQYLVCQLENIEKTKDKEKNINSMVKKIILPTARQIKEVLIDLKVLLSSINRQSINIVENITSNFEDFVRQKDNKVQLCQQEIQSLKKQNKMLKQQMNTTEKKITGQKIDNIASKIRTSPPNSDFQSKSSKKKEQTTCQNRVKCQLGMTNAFKNNPYLLSQSQTTNKLKSPIQKAYQNHSCSKQTLNKTINISYRCLKAAGNQTLTPSKSTGKLSPQKVLQERLNHANIINTSSSHTLNRKDLIKQKIQNMKQRNGIQLRHQLAYPLYKK